MAGYPQRETSGLIARRLTVMQLLPELEVGGVERGTLEIAAALCRAGHRALVVCAPGRLVEELESCGAEHISLAIGEKRIGSLRHVRSLRKLIVERQVDIVHARSRLPAWLGHLACKRLSDVARPAWVTTVHGPYSVNPYSRIMVTGEVVIAISEFIKRYIVDSYRGIEAHRIEMIPRGVDRNKFHFGFTPPTAWMSAWQADHPALAGKALLTLPARLTRWKGQLDFIEMIARLRRRDANVHGLIAGAAHRGRGSFEDELKHAVQRLGLARDITFLGHRRDLREILAISDIAYSLAREPEAFGRTTVEALSLGTPVIGFEHGGTVEILRSVFPQGLVNVGDVAAAADLTAQLLESQPQLPREHPFTLTRMQDATLSVYQRLSHHQRV
ncbi:MAG: glycosyltransferase family 4 protein [Proteobacteria bacterium]|nr:glycosyltransferase family 4 protein [Pseudomonadota bacterium]